MYKILTLAGGLVINIRPAPQHSGAGVMVPHTVMVTDRGGRSRYVEPTGSLARAIEAAKGLTMGMDIVSSDYEALADLSEKKAR